jgi:hypothetical protein
MGLDPVSPWFAFSKKFVQHQTRPETVIVSVSTVHLPIDQIIYPLVALGQHARFFIPKHHESKLLCYD